MFAGRGRNPENEPKVTLKGKLLTSCVAVEHAIGESVYYLNQNDRSEAKQRLSKAQSSLNEIDEHLNEALKTSFVKKGIVTFGKQTAADIEGLDISPYRGFRQSAERVMEVYALVIDGDLETAKSTLESWRDSQLEMLGGEATFYATNRPPLSPEDCVYSGYRHGSDFETELGDTGTSYYTAHANALLAFIELQAGDTAQSAKHLDRLYHDILEQCSFVIPYPEQTFSFQPIISAVGTCINDHNYRPKLSLSNTNFDQTELALSTIQNFIESGRESKIVACFGQITKPLDEKTPKSLIADYMEMATLYALRTPAATEHLCHLLSHVREYFETHMADDPVFAQASKALDYLGNPTPSTAKHFLTLIRQPLDPRTAELTLSTAFAILTNSKGDRNVTEVQRAETALCIIDRHRELVNPRGAYALHWIERSSVVELALAASTRAQIERAVPLQEEAVERSIAIIKKLDKTHGRKEDADALRSSLYGSIRVLLQRCWDIDDTDRAATWMEYYLEHYPDKKDSQLVQKQAQAYIDSDRHEEGEAFIQGEIARVIAPGSLSDFAYYLNLKLAHAKIKASLNQHEEQKQILDNCAALIADANPSADTAEKDKNYIDENAELHYQLAAYHEHFEDWAAAEACYQQFEVLLEAAGHTPAKTLKIKMLLMKLNQVEDTDSLAKIQRDAGAIEATLDDMDMDSRHDWEQYLKLLSRLYRKREVYGESMTEDEAQHFQALFTRLKRFFPERDNPTDEEF